MQTNEKKSNNTLNRVKNHTEIDSSFPLKGCMTNTI